MHLCVLLCVMQSGRELKIVLEESFLWLTYFKPLVHVSNVILGAETCFLLCRDSNPREHPRAHESHPRLSGTVRLC